MVVCDALLGVNRAHRGYSVQEAIINGQFDPLKCYDSDLDLVMSRMLSPMPEN